MRRRKRSRRNLLLIVIVFVALTFVSFYLYFSFNSATKPIILYVNQGNGRVDETNFAQMLEYAKARKFNTIFFQVYRQGEMLFNVTELNFFINKTHAYSMKIFFSFYITSSNQTIPNFVLLLNEDGINLDMSTIPLQAQELIYNNLRSHYKGEIAITTTYMEYPIKPDLLVLETYYPDTMQYIRKGIIASVGVFTVNSYQEYIQEFNYALQHSDGVMVFDYAGLLKRGY